MGTWIVNLFPKNHLYKTKEDSEQFAYYCDARFVYIERHFCLCTQISWHKWCTHYYESSSFYVPFFLCEIPMLGFQTKYPNAQRVVATQQWIDLKGDPRKEEKKFAYGLFIVISAH